MPLLRLRESDGPHRSPAIGPPANFAVRRHCRRRARTPNPQAPVSGYDCHGNGADHNTGGAFSLLPSRNLLKKCIGSQNWYPLERAQREEVIVPGDDVSSLTADRKLKELVVAPVAARRDFNIHFNPFCLFHECGEKPLRLFFSDVFAEFLAAEDFIEFCQRRKRKEERAAARGMVKGTPRDRLFEQKSAHQDVGIEDEAQVTLLSKGIPVPRV